MSETRDVIKLRLAPAGDEKPGPVELFDLVQITEHQVRVRATSPWRTDHRRGDEHRKVLVRDLTRTQVSALAADTLDWLTYVEGGAE